MNYWRFDRARFSCSEHRFDLRRAFRLSGQCNRPNFGYHIGDCQNRGHHPVGRIRVRGPIEDFERSQDFFINRQEDSKIYGEDNQSSGNIWMPQTFAGSSSSSPNSQRLSPFETEMQCTIRAVTFLLVGSPCNSTRLPIRTG